MARLILLSVLLAATTAPRLLAQDARTPIETDRPDFTEASSVVGYGRIQIEAGWTYTRSREDGAPGEHSWPELLARIGLTQAVELRLGLGAVSTTPLTGERFTALEDLYVGTKIALGEQRGAVPQLAMMVQATIPTGDDRLSNDRVLPGVALLAGWATSGSWSYATAVQVNRVGSRGVEVAPSVAVGLQFTPALKAYGEWFAFLPAGTAGSVAAEHYLNGGVALGLGPDLQLDARVGAGIGDASDRVFFGLGASIRR
ncbi:MAG: transporter [Gemmatimonadales bacterium]|nr:transporter [Gemmatimonadales bacterium]